MTPLTDSLLAFVRDELLRGRDVNVDPDTYLFEAGMIDSLAILRLIAFLEKAIGREIADREVVMEHFKTIRTIARTFEGGRSLHV